MSETRILNVVLCHLPPAETDAVLEYIQALASGSGQEHLLVYGGLPQAMHEISHKPVVSCDRARLVAGPDLQRDRQNYTGVFRAVVDWVAANPTRRHFDYVAFQEFDELPVTPRRNERLRELLEAERADVLGHRLRRVDGTNSPLYLAHAIDRNFAEFWQKITVRRPPEPVVLQMLGTSSFWRRQAFEAVARLEEPFPVYLELWIPTAAHHLGFRVRPIRRHVPFVSPQPLPPGRIQEALDQEEILSVHPVKTPEDFATLTTAVRKKYNL